VAAVRAAAYASHVLACPNCGNENPDDASFCMACATSLTRVTPAREVRKTVTVLFCDIVGSTSLGDRRDPELVRRVIYRYFDEMRRVVERHGGTVEKFIGDAVMAVFGVPHVHEDDALRAVRAAAEMRSALDLLNDELERDPGGVTLQIRIGVNTGEVVAANPAIQSLVLGDAVNVAAKLEQAAGPGEVLIGEDTHLLVRDAIVAEDTATVDIKGRRRRSRRTGSSTSSRALLGMSAGLTRRWSAESGRSVSYDRRSRTPSRTGPASWSRSSARPAWASLVWWRSSFGPSSTPRSIAVGACPTARG
jgi:class 3 adenylate cyclase